MTEKKRSRFGIIAALVLILLLIGSGFFIFTQQRPDLFLRENDIITRGEFASIMVRDIPLETKGLKKNRRVFPISTDIGQRSTLRL